MTDTPPTQPAERFHALFVRHYPAVHAYAARRVGPEDAPDVASEVFTVAWRRIGDAPAEPSTLPWLYGVAKRTVSNHRRFRRRQARLTAKALAEPSGTTNQDPSSAVAVRAALASLADSDREILRLSAWEGLDPAQIATVLGCSANAASVRLHRARRRLAIRLGIDSGESR